MRLALYGHDPDRATMLYRVRQFLAVLHATPLVEFVTADDPRLTYLPLATGVFEPLPGVVPDDLGQVMARLESVGDPVLLDLFGVAPEEPMRSWKNLWASTMPLPYRLGGLLLALAVRTSTAIQAGAPHAE